jgi:Cu/Ag efflux pump CusA
MVRFLIAWSVNNPLIVMLLLGGLIVGGLNAFWRVNVEAYPDPAPPIIEVVAQYPGASAEEVERQVTIPLEVALAGMPGLTHVRTKSMFGLCHMRNQFEYGTNFLAARQEIINRLQFVSGLPPGVSPQISPFSPTGELMRYTIYNPKDEQGEGIYTLQDLKAYQDWTLNRVFRRVPRIADDSSFGGKVKRYEINPNPDKMRNLGLSFVQIQNAIANCNSNVGGDYHTSGKTVQNVRILGLIGGGKDPQQSLDVLDAERREFERYLGMVKGLEKFQQQRLEKLYDGHWLWPFASEEEKALLANIRAQAGPNANGKAALESAKPLIEDYQRTRFQKAFAQLKVDPPLTPDESEQLKAARQEVGIRAAIASAKFLREEERRRLLEIRDVVITAVNNHPLLVNDVVEGQPLINGRYLTYGDVNKEGVIVGNQTRLGKVARTYRELDANGNEHWVDQPDVIQGIVLLRRGEDTLPAILSVKDKVNELNETPGKLLAGTHLDVSFDISNLIALTTETVRENLLMGMVLVVVILLMFLSNVRSAIIVAINIPLALLFAYSALYLRGKSANLLSIGAVDFGIIVDSSVIMVENIYRHVSSGENAHLPLKDRIIKASSEVERSLFFSTLIMVCAFLPLFTMQGPEGQIFGPMAQTYAFALGGALLLALTAAPALCVLFFRGLKPSRDNFFVRYLKTSYLRQLQWCLHHRVATLVGMGSLVVITAILTYFFMGREFLPELEEGNLYIRGTLPVNISLDEGSEKVRMAREIMTHYPEVLMIVSQVGRPDDGTDPSSYFNAEFNVPLKPEKEWPIPKTAIPPGGGVRGRLESLDADKGSFVLVTEDGQRREFTISDQTLIFAEGMQTPDGLRDKRFQPSGWLFKTKPELAVLTNPAGFVKEVHREYDRQRTKPEIIRDMNAELTTIVGVDWNFSQYIRDNVTESLSGVKGDNSVKIFGPDLEELERLAPEVKAIITDIRGIKDVGIFRIKGQGNLEFGIDRAKASLFGTSVADVENTASVAIGAKAFNQMVEGEKTFDMALRLSDNWRRDEEMMKRIPVDIYNSQIAPTYVPATSPTISTGAAAGVSTVGSSQILPTNVGSQFGGTYNPQNAVPRRNLRELVVPVDDQGRPNPGGSFVRSGASTIFREQGNRMIAIKFSVRDRDLAGAVAEARKKVDAIIHVPYRTEWSGEFEEMQAAEQRLMVMIPASFLLVLVLLYLAFNSVVDTVMVLSNVLALSLGGIWALLLTGTNFSVAAAVGFISIFGVGIMDGLLLVSYFNAHRAEGMSLEEAIMKGAEKRMRPMMMTDLTAMFGLLPAALSTRIGSQAQQPLAIVVVGGMITTLLLTRYLMPVLYSFYGHREPARGARGLAH